MHLRGLNALATVELCGTMYVYDVCTRIWLWRNHSSPFFLLILFINVFYITCRSLWSQESTEQSTIDFGSSSHDAIDLHEVE